MNSRRISQRRALVARSIGMCVGTALGLWSSQVSAGPNCDPSASLGVSRTVQIDATNGPLFGGITKFSREESFLQPREVMLTFDDGPLPWITKSILDTLDRQCTKATFFSVGRMALAYPDTVRDVVARGHTLGTHTWSHPLNLNRRNRAWICRCDRRCRPANRAIFSFSGLK
jgi:peptidoglycan-N-acetylglucosamine deacetylase